MLITRDYTYFKNLYEEYYAGLASFAYSLLYDRDEANDIVQEVFFYLWDNAGKVEINSSMKSYLFTSVKNKALNKIKHYQVIDSHNERIREAYLYAEIADPGPDKEMIERVEKIISDMPDQMKKVFVLHTTGEMKCSDIASELNISSNTVKTHIKRAFKTLRSKLLVLLFFV